jgi:nitrogen PTS system EIIA component
MDWWKQFKASACSVKVSAKEKDAVLEELVGNLVSAKVLDKSLQAVAVKALQERELVASTGIGMNVAIPHVKIPGLETVALGLAVLPEPLDWSAVDGEPVSVIFVILRPENATETHNPTEHLEMMRWIAGLGRDSDFRSFAIQAKTRTDLVQLLKEKAPA